jgi:hypothetical protein
MFMFQQAWTTILLTIPNSWDNSTCHHTQLLLVEMWPCKMSAHLALNLNPPISVSQAELLTRATKPGPTCF